MEKFNLLKKQITEKINAENKKSGAKDKDSGFDAGAFVNNAVEFNAISNFNCILGTTSFHPIDFRFKNSSLAGSYFLGPCNVENSIVFRSDVRGDELKCKDDVVDGCVPLQENEKIFISSSLLYKTLVHNFSHDPASLENFLIKNTIACHYANIHGANVQGCFLGPFSTIDLMNLNACIVGEFAYVQSEDIFNERIDPGHIYIQTPDFCFSYRYSADVLDKYIGVNELSLPSGIIYQFVVDRESEIVSLRDFKGTGSMDVPATSAVHYYSLIKGDTRIGENVLVSQKAWLDNADMGDGANAQENTYIINSRLEGMNVSAHGAKIIHADLGRKTFTGFNAFVRGRENAKLTTGRECMIMPHTIIDIEQPLSIPEKHAVWGYISCEKDLETNCIAIEKLSAMESGEITSGSMSFKGSGKKFIEAFSHRIDHILEANGAFEDRDGHAQYDKNISLNILQAYKSGDSKGIYPNIRIKS